MTYNVYRHGGKPYIVQLVKQNISKAYARWIVEHFKNNKYEYWLEECNEAYQAMSKDGL